MANPHKNLDLHSLECLDALLREKSVSRAAERVGLSQSAMSEVLARLRERFGDPLLVRGRAGMQSTPRAEALLPRLRDVLERLNELASASPAFDPQSCEMRFRLATSDYTQFMFMPTLVNTLRTLAPAVCIDVLPVNILRVEAALEAGDIDLAIAYFPSPPQGLRSAPMFSEHYVWIARKNHPRIRDGLSAQEFAALNHLVVAPSGLTYFSGVVDEALDGLGLTRRSAVSSPHFLLAAHLVASSDLVLALPSRAAARIAQILPVECRPLPFDTKSIELCIYWHERVHHSAPHQWFRSQVKDALSENASLRRPVTLVTSVRVDASVVPGREI